MKADLDKDTVYQKYIVENLSRNECAELFNISERQFARQLKKLHIKKDRRKVIECDKRVKSNQVYPKMEFIPEDKDYDCYRLYNIDATRLNRDYIKYPIVTNEIIKRADLEYLYIEKKLIKTVISKILNCNVSKIIGALAEYNIHRTPKEDKQAMTLNNELLGIIHHTKTEEYKEKYKEMMLEKYGVDNYSKTTEFKEKYKAKMLEKYGVDNYFRIYDEYGRKNRTNNHITDENYEIITHKDLLEEYLSHYETAYSAAETLNISCEYLYSLIKKFDINKDFKRRFSSYEEELRTKLPIAIYNKRIYDKELDFYYENQHFGIEFNGNYWHSELHKNMNYHKNKSLYFRDKGIFVYHIYEYEWNDERKRKIILSQLNNHLEKNTEKIYARKCEIKEIDKNVKAKFLNDNHIQGNDRCKYSFGLYYNDELVMVMTFSKPKFNKKYEWELSRSASKLGCNVVGGASKLFKYFVKNYKPESIISYSDIGKTKGKIYEILNFTQMLITRPNYVWWKGSDIKLKSQTRKDKLKNFDTTKSESMIMHSLGYARIYNSGLIQWVWKSNL